MISISYVLELKAATTTPGLLLEFLLYLKFLIIYLLLLYVHDVFGGTVCSATHGDQRMMKGVCPLLP